MVGRYCCNTPSHVHNEEYDLVPIPGTLLISSCIVKRLCAPCSNDIRRTMRLKLMTSLASTLLKTYLAKHRASVVSHTPDHKHIEDAKARRDMNKYGRSLPPKCLTLPKCSFLHIHHTAALSRHTAGELDLAPTPRLKSSNSTRHSSTPARPTVTFQRRRVPPQHEHRFSAPPCLVA